MYIIGENPLVSDPDLNHTQKSLSNLDFLVVQDIFLTETAQLADVVLPAVCFAEKEGTFSNTEPPRAAGAQGRGSSRTGTPDWEIICDIAPRGWATRCRMRQRSRDG